MAENTPDIRFHEFRENWKCIKIDDVITEKKRPIVLDDDTTYQLITVKRRNEGVVSRGFLKGKQILVKNYFEVKVGDYVISKRQVVHGANGIVPEKLDGAIVSNEYLVATENDNITTEFLTLISKLPAMYKKFFISSYGIDIEKLVFDVDDWKKRTLSIPDTDEQKKITAFFENFDKLHADEQQKYDRLVNFKKSMLDKMFPKDDAKVPAIRFGGFSGEWKPFKLGDLGKCYSGIGFPDKEQGGSVGIPFYKVSDMNNRGNECEMTNANNYVTTEQVMRNRWKPISKVPAIVFAKVGAAIMLNRKRLALFPFLIDNNTMTYIFDNTWDTYFGKTTFDKIDLTTVVQVGALPSYNSCDVEAIEIHLPLDFQEQVKIGKFFRNLDAQITLQHKKLQKLTNIKKAFLEKMFL